MKSFVTGSRAYGTIRPGSDIDLVVYVSAKDAERLRDMAEVVLQVDGEYAEADIGMSLRFGNLNLICVTNEESFEIWRKGTMRLKKKRPVTRDFAIKFLKELRQQAGWKKKGK